MSAAEIEQLATNSHLLGSRKVMLAIARHVHTPRRIAIPLIRQLFAFELMQVALTPAVPADIKQLAEECILAKLSSITFGERLTLAKRASTRVAAALLHDPEPRVRHSALDNPYLTESYVTRAILKAGASKALLQAVSHHPKWMCRVEVRRALESLDNARHASPAQTGRPPGN